jgi:hypothetical protein
MEQRDPVNLDVQPSADNVRSTKETLEQLGAPNDDAMPMTPKNADSTVTFPGAMEHNTTSGLDMAQSAQTPISGRSLDDSAANDPF